MHARILAWTVATIARTLVPSSRSSQTESLSVLCGTPCLEGTPEKNECYQGSLLGA